MPTWRAKSTLFPSSLFSSCSSLILYTSLVTHLFSIPTITNIDYLRYILFATFDSQSVTFNIQSSQTRTMSPEQPIDREREATRAASGFAVECIALAILQAIASVAPENLTRFEKAAFLLFLFPALTALWAYGA